LFKELKECFDFFDVDQSGSISTDELKKLFEKLGFHVNESELQNIIQLMDKVKLKHYNLFIFKINFTICSTLGWIWSS
jgi:Ca2+-binding EF-hand superfamily protein